MSLSLNVKHRYMATDVMFKGKQTHTAANVCVEVNPHT